jgi:hypothetical protein
MYFIRGSHHRTRLKRYFSCREIDISMLLYNKIRFPVGKKMIFEHEIGTARRLFLARLKNE